MSDTFDFDDSADHEDDPPESGPPEMSGPLGELQKEWRELLNKDTVDSYPSAPPEGFAVEDENALFNPYLQHREAGAQVPSSPDPRYPGDTGDGGKGGPLTAGVAPTYGEGDGAMNFSGYANDYHLTALQQRRLDDERASGRHWPSMEMGTPSDPHEAQFFQQMAIGIGEVDPHVLARESALRYVRASRVSGDDQLAATDIYAIMYYGLGLTLRPLNCTSLPQVMAVYHRQNRDLHLDWELLKDPPHGKTALDTSAWRRSVDSSQLARFLIAWCIAIHLTDNYGIPLVLGFVPGEVGSAASTPTLSADTFNRYRIAIEAVGSLLAPVERLWQQINALGWPVRPGDSEWRAHLRRAYRYAEGSRGPANAGDYGIRQYAQQAPGAGDPVDRFLAVLAEYNNCPPLIIEAQLDGPALVPDWYSWSQRLLREIPMLAMRHASAAKAFARQGAMQQTWGGAVPAVPAGQARLSL